MDYNPINLEGKKELEKMEREIKKFNKDALFGLIFWVVVLFLAALLTAKGIYSFVQMIEGGF